MNSATASVLVYARASSDPKDLRVSVDHQITRCRRYAAEHWPDAEVREFRDDDLSGSKPGVVRKGFDQFRHAVRTLPKGSVAAIVVNEQSRLTRQGERSWQDIVVLLSVAGVETVHSLKEGPISVKAGSRLVGTLLSAIHQETAERIAADVKNTHAELFAEGRPSGRAPFGYQSVKDEKGRPALEPDPVEGPVVKWVFEQALAGHALLVIADKLNRGGVPPHAARWKFKDERKLTRWTAATVRHLLTAPSMAGLRAHTDEAGVLQTTLAKWEALIDADQWRQVQRLLGQPSVVKGTNGESYKVRSKPAPQPRTYLLSGGRRRGLEGPQSGELYGVLRCGLCDHPMTAKPQTRRDGTLVPAYACHSKKNAVVKACGGVSISPAKELEDSVVEAVQRRLAASPGLRQRLTVAQDAEGALWRAERDAAQRRMLDAGHLLGSGTIDKPTFLAMNAAAKAVYESAEGRLATLTSDTVLPTAEDVMHGWDKLTLTVQRAVVEKLVRRIVVSPGVGLARVGEPEWLAPL